MKISEFTEALTRKYQPQTLNESLNESYEQDWMTPAEAKEYWEENSDYDPVLAGYNGDFSAWYKDSVENGYIQESLKESFKVLKGEEEYAYEDLSSAGINPKDVEAYAGGDDGDIFYVIFKDGSKEVFFNHAGMTQSATECGFDNDVEVENFERFELNESFKRRKSRRVNEDYEDDEDDEDDEFGDYGEALDSVLPHAARFKTYYEVNGSELYWITQEDYWDIYDFLYAVKELAQMGYMCPYTKIWAITRDNSTYNFERDYEISRNNSTYDPEQDDEFDEEEYDDYLQEISIPQNLRESFKRKKSRKINEADLGDRGRYDGPRIIQYSVDVYDSSFSKSGLSESDIIDALEESGIQVLGCDYQCSWKNDHDYEKNIQEALKESRGMEEDERAAYQGQKAKDAMYAMSNTDAMNTYEKHKKSSDDGDLSQTYDRLAEIGAMARKHNNRRRNVGESLNEDWEWDPTPEQEEVYNAALAELNVWAENSTQGGQGTINFFDNDTDELKYAVDFADEIELMDSDPGVEEVVAFIKSSTVNNTVQPAEHDEFGPMPDSHIMNKMREHGLTWSRDKFMACNRAWHAGELTRDNIDAWIEQNRALLGESLNEAKKGNLPIRKALQDADIMKTLDKDPNGTFKRAIEVVKNSPEVSDKDKRDFIKYMSSGSREKKASTLASYFYDVNLASI